MPEFSGAQFMQAVKDITGIAVKDFEQRLDGSVAEKGDLSVRQAIRAALNYTPPNDKSDEEKKLDYYGIQCKIFGTADERIELSSEEVVMIKNKVKQRWTPEVLGFITQILEGKNKDFALIKQEKSNQEKG